MPGLAGEWYMTDMLRMALPAPNEIVKRLRKLEGRVQGSIAKKSLRAAAGVYRTALRQAARAHKDSGDLAKSVFVVVRKGRQGGYYALVGFKYGKYGDPPKSPQDPAVYAFFLESGAVRRDRGRVTPTKFASKVSNDVNVRGNALRAFIAKFNSEFESYEDRTPWRTHL